MALDDLLRNVADAITGKRDDRQENSNIRPASEDPHGDPADDPRDMARIRPASEDPLGDPADEINGQRIRPASEDPYGDPADDPRRMANIRPASEDPYGDPADQEAIHGAVDERLAMTDPAATESHVGQILQGMAPGQANNLAGSLLNLVQQQGVDVNGLCAQLGISPGQCGSALSQVMGYLHQNHPQALSRAAAQEPGIAGLLGNAGGGGLLGQLASRFLGGGR